MLKYGFQNENNRSVKDLSDVNACLSLVTSDATNSVTLIYVILIKNVLLGAVLLQNIFHFCLVYIIILYHYFT